MSLGPQISRRTAVGLMAGSMAAAAVNKALPVKAATTKRPNVVFVLLDDVGYGDLACLGNPIIKTPNIDAMHEVSTRFTNFHVSPTCSPTRAAVMTGKYPHTVGVWHTIYGRNLMDPRVATIADRFRASGYRTANYGKWHLGDNYPCRPQDRGFDDAVVCGGGGIWQTPDYFGNDDMNDSYLHNGEFQKYSGFSTDVFFNLSMDFMLDAQKRGEPFFIYLATTAAHDPTWAKEKDQAPYEGVVGLPTAGFYGMIANADENIGRLRKFLEDHQLADDTLLIYSSDNGTSQGENVFNADMRGAKNSPYDGGHRMPFFMHWPGGGLTRGRDVDTLTAHIDIYPTLVEICGLKDLGKDIDGKSLQPLLQGESASWPERTIVTDSQRGEYMVKWKQAAVMTQRWRLVNPTMIGNPQALELYDMEHDPSQKVNVAAKHPDVVAQMKQSYDEWWRENSAHGDEIVRIVIGNDAENPSRLDCMDWHGHGAELANNQAQIRSGPIGNGFWAIDVDRAGRYRFELRRWPLEVDLPITAPYVDAKPNREKTPGVAIAAKKATIMIGDILESKPVPPLAKFVEFTLDLPKGPAQLRTAFYDDLLNERGAYYVYVQRL